MLLYAIMIIILILITLYLYYKFKHPFWSRQPVFHIHNLWYWYDPPGIIQTGKPERNKYYKADIEFDTFDNISAEKKALLNNIFYLILFNPEILPKPLNH